jgi:hypothetical protein
VIRARTLPSRLRRRPHLRAVPEPASTGPGLVHRLAGLVDAPTRIGADQREALARTAAATLAAAATAVLLNALPFYPAGWAYGLAVLVGFLALARPLGATALAGALALPLVGNVAMGLVPLAAVGVLVWCGAIASAPRRAFVPALAPVAALAAVSPLYLLGAGTARRAHVRFVLGAAGPIAITLACGVAGLTSPLSGLVPAAGLNGSIAGAESVPLVAQRLADAVGQAVVVQSLVWGLAALAALPAWRLTGGRLRLFAACWIGTTTLATVLAPLLVGGQAAPLAPAAVGAIVAAILLGLRSVARPADPAAAATPPAP